MRRRSSRSKEMWTSPNSVYCGQGMERATFSGFLLAKNRLIWPDFLHNIREKNVGPQENFYCSGRTLSLAKINQNFIRRWVPVMTARRRAAPNTVDYIPNSNTAVWYTRFYGHHCLQIIRPIIRPFKSGPQCLVLNPSIVVFLVLGSRQFWIALETWPWECWNVF